MKRNTKEFRTSTPEQNEYEPETKRKMVQRSPKRWNGEDLGEWFDNYFNDHCTLFGESDGTACNRLMKELVKYSGEGMYDQEIVESLKKKISHLRIQEVFLQGVEVFKTIANQ